MCRRARLGLEAQNDAAVIKLRSERLAGALLRQLERGDPVRDRDTGQVRGRMSNDGQSASPYARTLEAANVSRQDATRWQ